MKSLPLKPCPFCGAQRPTLKVLSNTIIRECSHCATGRDFAVICDAQKGGCGSTGGYQSTKQLAADLWNTRSSTITTIAATLKRKFTRAYKKKFPDDFTQENPHAS